MAKAQTLSFSKFKVLIDPDSTGTFTAPCGFNGSSFGLSKDLNDSVVPDCDDPEALPWKDTEAVSRAASVDGEGVMAGQSQDKWRTAWLKDTSIPCRIQLDTTGAQGGGYWAGNFHVTTLDWKANRGALVAFSIKMVSDGPLTWTAAA